MHRIAIAHRISTLVPTASSTADMHNGPPIRQEVIPAFGATNAVADAARRARAVSTLGRRAMIDSLGNVVEEATFGGFFRWW